MVESSDRVQNSPARSDDLKRNKSRKGTSKQRVLILTEDIQQHLRVTTRDGDGVNHQSVTFADKCVVNSIWILLGNAH